jgi:DNA-binding NarL/FixJ family response regulator
MANIWVIEDHIWLRDSIREAVEKAGCGSVHCFPSCESALSRLHPTKSPPAVILLDLGLPGMSGLEGLREIKRRSPETQVIVFTVMDSSKSVFEAIRGGASGYLLKSEPLSRVVTAIQEVARGGAPMTAEVARRVLDHFARLGPPASAPARRPAAEDDDDASDDLSPREREVLRLLASGLAKKEVATQMKLSFHTIDNYVRRIYSKLHVNSVGAAVARAFRKGEL